MEAFALSLLCGPLPHGSDSDLQTLAFMRLRDPHGRARKAANKCYLSVIWRTGKSTAGFVKSHSDPFSNSHSRVEKPMALACFETTPHPAKNSAKNFPVTRTGGDCLLSEGRGRYPRHEATRVRSMPAEGLGTGRRLVRGGHSFRTSPRTVPTSTVLVSESRGAALPRLRGRGWLRCGDIDGGQPGHPGA